MFGHSIFQSRDDAGERLADALYGDYGARHDVVVLALPRGGVPVAAPVAQALNAPLDVMLVRKLGVPGREELAMGAIASGDVRVLNPDVIAALDIPDDAIEDVAKKEEAELKRRMLLYRGDRSFPDVKGRTVILIDDGLATGASMRVAIAAVRRFDPREIVVAVPIASSDVLDSFEDLVDDVIVLAAPDPFYGVGYWYADFSQTTDDEVRRLLKEAHDRIAATSA